MRNVIKEYIDKFNHYLNMPNICWWIIDFENEPKYFYCNEHMKEVFSLDKSLEKHSIAETCPIAGEYNKNIIDFGTLDNKAKIIFDEYKKLLSLEIDTYHNTFPYYNSKSNKLEYFSSRAKVLEKDKNGKVSILLGIIEDITLQETQKLQLEEAHTIAKLGSWSYDLVNYSFSCSPEISKIFEIDNIKDINELRKLIYFEDIEKINDIYINSLKKKELYEVIYRIQLKDKRIKWIKEQAKTVFSKDTTALITIGTMQDITSEQEYFQLLKKRDKQLYESQKLASMGEMLNNIAHHWRQPLSSISTLSSGTSLACEQENINLKEIKNNLDTITKITKDLSQTIDDFNYFFKPDTSYDYFTMEELINKTLSLVKPNLNIKYTQLKIENLSNCTIYGPRMEYIRILINLINNANEAFENKKQENRIIKIRTEKLDNICTIQVEDNAGGIPKSIVNRVFEPYFTTKHKSQGTGLGLYMAKEIVEKHLNGKLEFTNTNEGAKFIMKIPNEMCKII